MRVWVGESGHAHSLFPQRVFGLGRDVSAVHKDGSVLPVRLSVSEKKDDNKRIFTAIIQKLN